jgi:uncharacterized protein
LTLYLDTSLLVAALTREVRTARAQAWIAGRPQEELAYSDWVVAEFSSALAAKLRNREITAGRRAGVLAQFSQMISTGLLCLSITGAQMRTAARFVDQHALGLRAGDAFHLAICAEHGATLCTLDRRLSEAGPVLGVETILV